MILVMDSVLLVVKCFHTWVSKLMILLTCISISYAYDVRGVSQDIYDAYDTGASIDYATDMFSVGLWSSLESDAGFEYAFAFTGVENLTVKAIWSDGDQSPELTKNLLTGSVIKWINCLLAAEVAEKILWIQ